MRTSAVIEASFGKVMRFGSPGPPIWQQASGRVTRVNLGQEKPSPRDDFTQLGELSDRLVIVTNENLIREPGVDRLLPSGRPNAS